MSEQNVLLECVNLKKYFNTPRGVLHAVDDVSFRLETGKTLGVVGESGCGKSTLGRTILRLLPATEGQIIFNGEDITHLPDKEMLRLRKEMQIVFQDPFSSLDPKMTVSQIIEEPLKIHKLYQDKSARLERVSELMETVGLDDRYVNTYPHELDGGRRQRIGIARAIALNPKFIVCDEPVSALDVSIQAQILNLMMELQRERNLTYLFITHNLSVVKHISDDITVMYLGQMVEKAGASEIFAHQYHPYTKALISAIPQPKYNAPDQQIILKGEITSPINVTRSCRFAPRCVYAKPECFEQEPQLEEVSKDHFVKCHFVREINGL